MRRRPPHFVELPDDEYEFLESLVKDGRTEQRIARRARILLSMTEQETIVQELADKLDLSINTIRNVTSRYEEVGVESIFDAPRTGRPREISPPPESRDRTVGLLSTSRNRSPDDPLVYTKLG